MFGGGPGFGGWVVIFFFLLLILLCWVVVNIREEKWFHRGEEKKKNKKNYLHMNSNRAYMHGYCSFVKPWCIFAHFYKDLCGCFLG